MRQVVLDTETTGLAPEDGHRIIEIGAVELKDRRMTGRDFWTYLNPERAIDAGATEVHGLRAEDLQDKPRFAEIVESLLEFLAGDELIIHN
ncbi:DNA polymerase III epsilon subunit, partial [mine drainage metagenome]